MGKTQSKQNLTPEEFDELVESTDFTTAEIDEWFEKFKDKFPKGRVSPREFKAVYHELYPAGDADRFCGHIFRVYDMDGNGVISFAEFLTTLHVSARGSPDEKLQATFRLYDIDRNGFVTPSEISEILTVSDDEKKLGKGAITSKIKHAINLKQVLQDLHNSCSPHWHFVLACS